MVIKDLTGCSGVFTLRSTDIDKKLGFIEVHVRVHSAQGQVLTHRFLLVSVLIFQRLSLHVSLSVNAP